MGQVFNEIAQAIAPCEVRAVMTAAMDEKNPSTWVSRTTATQIRAFFPLVLPMPASW